MSALAATTTAPCGRATVERPVPSEGSLSTAHENPEARTTSVASATSPRRPHHLAHLSAGPMSAANRCVACSQRATTRCSACHVVRFCSTFCQKLVRPPPLPSPPRPPLGSQAELASSADLAHTQSPMRPRHQSFLHAALDKRRDRAGRGDQTRRARRRAHPDPALALARRHRRQQNRGAKGVVLDGASRFRRAALLVEDESLVLTSRSPFTGEHA